MPETPLADAILVPVGYGPAGDQYALAVALITEFRPLLNPARGPAPDPSGDPALARKPRVWIKDSGTHRFLSLDLLAEPRDGEKRPFYTWRDRGDGVLLGTLVDRAIRPHPGSSAPPYPPAPRPAAFAAEQEEEESEGPAPREILASESGPEEER